MPSTRPKSLVIVTLCLAWAGLALVPFFQVNAVSFYPLVESLASIAVALWFWLLALGPGWRLLKLCQAFHDGKLDLRLRVSRLMLSTGLGLGLMAAVVLVTGMFIGVSSTTVLVALMALILFAAPAWKEVIRELCGATSQIIRRDWRRSELAALALILGIACLQLPAALTPSLYPDTLRYHFGLTKLYEQMGFIAPLKDFAESNLSSNWQMLYLPQLILSGDGIAMAFNWMALLLAAIAVALAAGSSVSALASAAVMISTPFLLAVAGLGNNDLGVTFFAALMWLALRTSSLRGASAWAGVFGGLAVGTKYPALIPAAAAMIACLALSGETLQARMRSAFHFTCGAFAGYLPWFIRNSAWTGDPFYPAFTRFLPWCGPEGKWVSMIYAKEMAHYGTGMTGLPRALLAPWRMTVSDPNYFESDVGVIFWCAVPLVVWAILKLPRERGLGDLRIPAFATLLAGMVWAVGPQVTRFLGPFAPAAALAIGLAWEGWIKSPIRAGFKRTAVVLALTLMAVNVWQTLVSIAGFSNPWMFLLGGMTQEEYRLQNSPVHRMALWCGHPERVNSKILFFGEESVYAFQNPVRLSGPFDKKWIVEEAARASSAHELADTLKREGIRYVCINVKKIDSLDRRFEYASWPSTQARANLARVLTEEATLVKTEGQLLLYDLSKPPPAKDLKSKP